MSISIRSTSIAEAVAISQRIPELVNPYRAAEYEKRFATVPHLILGAYDGTQAVGFKAGYEREGYFYSWMGGVLPSHRRRGVALLLLQQQEAWAKNEGYPSITFKTRNSHRNMLLFAIGQDYHIIGVDEKKYAVDNRIWLKKVLV